MTTKDSCLAIGFSAVLLSVACTQHSLSGPTDLASDSTAQAATSSTSGEPTVILQPDLTADPPAISVLSGQSVLMVNNSGQYVRVRSYNCTQFASMGLQAGVSRHTMPFYPAGKTCDYFAWDTNWSRQLFVGKVNVE